MTKLFFSGRFHALLTALVVLIAFASVGRAADRFALTVGPHDKLAIFGPNGEKIPEIAIASIDVPVTVAGVTFQVSFGHDMHQHLMAILTPSDSSPSELHFNVLGKSVDTSNDVALTLTFSTDLRSVSINPGHVGRVEVDGRRLGRE
jgi:hypothetical protein